MNSKNGNHYFEILQMGIGPQRFCIIISMAIMLIFLFLSSTFAEIKNVHVANVGSITEDEENYYIYIAFVLKWETTVPVSGYRIIEPDLSVHNVGSETTEFGIASVNETFSKNDYNEDDLQDLYMAVGRYLIQIAHTEKKTGWWVVEVVCGSGSGKTNFNPQVGQGIYNTVACERTLFSYPCRGMDITFVIQYNSDRIHKNEDLGFAWDHSFNMRFEQIDPEVGDPYDLVFHLGLEMERVIRNGEDNYDSPNPYMEIEDIDDGEKLRVRIKDMEYIFLWSTKKIISMTKIMERYDSMENTFPDNIGHTIGFNYYTDEDPDYCKGKLETITDSSGRVYTFIYWSMTNPSEGSIEGKLKEIIHPDGVTILAKFYYDTTDENLWRVCDAVNQTTEYVYRTLQQGDNVFLRHVLEEVHPSAGTNSYYEYKNLYEYDDPTTSEEVDIPVVTYSTLANGPNQANAIYAKVTVTQTNDKDQNGNLIHCYKKVADGEGWETEYTYSNIVGIRYGNPILKQVDPEGNIILWTYDDYENKTREVVTNGNDYWLVTINKYYEGEGNENDAKWGNVCRTITRKVEQEGFNPQSSYQGYSSYYAYLENLLETTPDHKYKYDEWGRAIESVDSKGIKECKKYKEIYDDYTSGMLRKTWIEAADESTSQEIYYEYYSLGDNSYLLNKKTQKLGPGKLDIVTEYSYYDGDDLKEGMLQKVQTKEGTSDPITETEYTYGSPVSFGVPTEVKETGQNGLRTTNFTYDNINRMITKILPPAQSGGSRHKTEWTYHWYDEIKTITESYGSDSGGWHQASKFQKDYSTLSGWVETEWEFINPAASTPNSEIDLKRSLTYYKNTLFETITSPRGQSENTKTEYIYFKNNLKKEIHYYKNENDYDSESITYYPDGNINTITNCRGFTTDNDYNEKNQLCTITDALTHESTFEYDGATDRITSQTNQEGEQTKSQYNKFGWLDKTTVILGVDDSSPSRPSEDHDDIITEYEYDQATGKVLEMTKVMDPSTIDDDILTTYDYDFRGLVEKTTSASGESEQTTLEYKYNNVGSVEEEKQFLEAGSPNRYLITKRSYDELDRNRKITVVMGLDDEQNPSDPEADLVTEYQYDSFTFSSSAPYVLRKDTEIDELGHKLEKYYDNFGQIVMTKLPMNESDPNDDITTLFEYDKNGNKIEETNAVETITQYDYDFRDRLIKTTYAVTTDLENEVLITLDENGNATVLKDQLQHETKYTYNTMDRLTKTEYADGTTVELTRDNVGRVTHYKDQENRTTLFYYDDAGRLIKTTGPDGYHVQLTLDAESNVIVKKDQEGKETLFQYDKLNRLINTHYADETDVGQTYNGAGTLVSLTDQRDHTTTYEYDDVNRLIRTTYPDPDGEGGDPSPTEEYEYWDTGVVKTHTDRNGSVISFQYDEADRLKLTTYPTGKEVKYIAYTYDKMDQILTIITKDSSEGQLSKVTRGYDELGRLDEETQEIATGATAKTISYSYDDVGNITDLSYPGGKALTYEYDNVYNLTAIKESDDSIASYQYNNAGELTRVGVLNGTRTDYTLDVMGRIQKMTNRYPSDNVISSYDHERNKVGYPTKITYHDGRYRNYTYDEIYRLTIEEHKDPQVGTLSWNDYEYDATGNRTYKHHDSAEGPELAYTYDNLNRLMAQIGDTGNKINVTGKFDEINIELVTVTNLETNDNYIAQIRGNLFIAHSVELATGVNDIQATAVERGDNSSSDTNSVTLDDSLDEGYEYDDNGCMISDGVYDYIYDYQNCLVEVKQGATTIESFKYDGLGRRIISEMDGVETRYIYDGESILQEYIYDTDWMLEAEYVCGETEDDIIALERDSNTYYYHYDGLGSVTEITDSNGVLVQAYEYDAWGNPTIYDPSATVCNTFLYTGRQWDAAIGLYYYRARHYSPRLGRFLQPDPGGYGDGPNLYAYVGSTPTAFIDPTGMDDYEYRGSDMYWVSQDETLGRDRDVSSIHIATASDTQYMQSMPVRMVTLDPWICIEAFGSLMMPPTMEREVIEVIRNTTYTGGLSEETRRGIIKKAFAGKGPRRGPGMLESAASGFGWSLAESAVSFPLNTYAVYQQDGVAPAVGYAGGYLFFGVTPIMEAGGGVDIASGTALNWKGRLHRGGIGLFTAGVQGMALAGKFGSNGVAAGESPWIFDMAESTSTNALGISAYASSTSTNAISTSAVAGISISDLSWSFAGTGGTTSLAGTTSTNPLGSIAGSTSTNAPYMGGVADITVPEMSWSPRTATGWTHHPISQAVYDTLEKSPTLKGLYKHRDKRFETNAIDKHYFDSFHRMIDKMDADWIRKNSKATPAEFENYLINEYNKPYRLERFPNGLKKR